MTTLPTLPVFGKSSNEWKRSGGSSAGGDYEIFFKNFRDDVTRPIQFLDDAVEAWTKYPMHFDKANRMSYPCARLAAEQEGQTAECFGCDYPSADPDNENDPGARVRKVQWQWVFPALDPKGYVSLYQIGVNFWESLKKDKQTYGTLLGHQWAVVKTKPDDGSFRVTYSAKILPGEPPREVKHEVPTKVYIQQQLTKKFMKAAETYGYSFGEGVNETAQGYNPPAADEAQATHAPDPVAAERPGDPASEALAAAKTAAAGKGDTPAAPEAQESAEAPAAPAETTDFNTLKTEQVKAWLDEHDVEYSSKAPRSVLVGLATKKAAQQ